MLFDKENMLSDNQPITETAVSGIIALAKGPLKEIAYGTPIPLRIQVTEDFVLDTDSQSQIQTVGDNDQSSGTDNNGEDNEETGESDNTTGNEEDNAEGKRQRRCHFCCSTPNITG